MTVLYSSDLEGLTVGAALSGWATARGAGAQVRSDSPVRGTRAYGRDSDQDAAYWTGNTGLGAQCIRHAQINNGSHYMGAILRAQGGSANQAYWCGILNSGGSLKLSVRVYDFGGVSYDESGSVFASVNGDVLHFEARAVGSTVELRLWRNSEARPSTASMTKATSQFSTGAVGVMKFGSFAWSTCDDIVITDAAGGEDLFYPPASTLSGGVTLDNISPSGSFSDAGPSGLSGGITLNDIAPSGAFGLAPGVLTSAPFKNWSGALLASTTIPKVAVVRITDMATVLTLTDQSTDGSGVLSISNVAIVPGVSYLLITCDAAGTAFGCEPYTAS